MNGGLSAPPPAGAPSLRPDGWAAGLFAVHLATALAAARLHPDHLFDPDLLASFVCVRDWATGAGTLRGLTFFFQPKPLLLLLLGLPGSVHAAVAVTALATGILGALVYLVGRAAFGRTAGVLWSLALLPDPSRTFLTLKSSADLYLAVFLFLAIALLLARRLWPAAVAVLLAALVKPVALPCAAQLLLAPGPWRRRLACAALPALAVPVTLLTNRALTGSALLPGQYLAEFAALRDAPGIGPGEVIHFALWTQLVSTRFVSTAPLGALGLLVWLAGDRRRLVHPLFLLPLLFLAGYLGLAVLTPYMPFYRFFWLLEVWFLGFIVFAMVEIGRRIAADRPRLATAATALLFVFLVDASLTRYALYRDQYALPIERNTAFARSAAARLASEPPAPDAVILTPLSFEPYLRWTSLERGRRATVVSAEAALRRGLDAAPGWILDIPSAYLTGEARALAGRLRASAPYEVVMAEGPAALLRLAPAPADPPQ